jgi:protein-L-isoaspartate(D-aspartate) O-methyltransferase
LLTGSLPILAQSWRDQLAPGGRLLAVVGDPPAMTARLVTCVSASAYNEVGLFET